MRNPDHPTAILKNAWCVVRLDVLRAAAKVAIEKLEELHQQDVREQAGSDRPGGPTSPTVAAWLVCCDEIRNEAGLPQPMPQAQAPTPGSGPDWSTSYREELERYRDAAGRTLGHLLDERRHATV